MTGSVVADGLELMMLGEQMTMWGRVTVAAPAELGMVMTRVFLRTFTPRWPGAGPEASDDPEEVALWGEENRDKNE